MAAKRFTGVSLKTINRVFRSPKVTRELASSAAIMLPRAQAIAYSAGATGTAEALKVETGVRPGAASRYGFQRTYARITVPQTKEVRRKDRGAKLSRRQILRRAAR